MTRTVLPPSTRRCSTEQLLDVREMKPGGRLVKDVQGAARRPSRQFRGELDALGLTAGQRGRRLPEMDVSQADVV